MTNDMNEIVLNPVRMRIIQAIASKESMTTNEICEKINDIPRTTVYRHIKVLIAADIIVITDEKKVRGSYERTLTLNTGQLAKHNTLNNASQNALAFLMQIYTKFFEYFSGEDPNPSKDRLFHNSTMLMADDDEFDQFLAELRELLVRYCLDYKDGRRARDISIISAPAESERIK